MIFKNIRPILYVILLSSSFVHAQPLRPEMCESDPLLDVANATNIALCFKSGDVQENAKQSELLKIDIEKCKCLEQKQKLYGAGFGSVMDVAKDYFQVALQHTMQGMKRQEEIRDNLAFQASVLFPGDSATIASYKINSVNTLVGNPDSQIASISNDLKLKGEEKKAFDKKVALVNLVNVQKDIFQEKPFEPGQCVGAREYLAVKQMPSRLIRAELRNNPEHSEAEWNVYAIREELDNIAKDPHRNEPSRIDRANLLKEKIRYLEYNPMIKYLMSTDTTSTGGTPEEKQSRSDKLQYKKNFYNLLRESFATKGITKETVESYTEKIVPFFINPGVASAITNEAKNASEVEYKRMSDVNMLKERSKKLPLAKDAVVQNFEAITGKSVRDCNSSNDSQFVECVSTFASYCRTVLPLESRLGTELLEDPRDTANVSDFVALNAIKADLKDPEFRRFNDFICNKPRKIPGDPKSKAKTYNEFKKDYCAGKSLPECKSNDPEEVKKIRTAYLDKYDKDNEFNAIVKGNPIESVDDKTMALLEDSSKKTNTTDWNSLAKPYGGDKINPASSTGSMASSSVVNQGSVTNDSNASSTGGAVAQNLPDSSTSSFNNSIPQSSSFPSSVSNIDELDEKGKKELLSDLKEEQKAFSENKGNSSQSPSEISATEKAMQERITALEALLADQQKVTAEQKNLLNQALAERQKKNETSIVNADPQRSAVKRSDDFNNPEFDNGVNRAPSSVPTYNQENPFTSPPKASDAAKSQARTSSNNAMKVTESAANNGDAVIREQSKLARSIENANGSITISAADKASNANSIVVNVSEAELTKYNLNDLVARISPDQIKALGSQGNYFVLFLQNGSNTVELKVKKDINGSLVQMTGSEPIRRGATLESLRFSLK